MNTGHSKIAFPLLNLPFFPESPFQSTVPGKTPRQYLFFSLISCWVRWFYLGNRSWIHPYLSTALVQAFDHLMKILIRASSMASRVSRPCSSRPQAPLWRRLCPSSTQRLTLASHFPSTASQLLCMLLWSSFLLLPLYFLCISHKVSNMHANSHLITSDLTSPSLGILSMLPGFISLLNKWQSIFQCSALKTCSINSSIISAKMNLPCLMIPKALCWYSLFTISNFCINRTLELMRYFQITHLILL